MPYRTQEQYYYLKLNPVFPQKCFLNIQNSHASLNNKETKINISMFHSFPQDNDDVINNMTTP